MSYVLISCRSLTYAQRMASLLEKFGIWANVVRTPKRLSASGCGYSVKIADADLDIVLEVIHENHMSYRNIFRISENGKYEEVLP